MKSIKKLATTILIAVLAMETLSPLTITAKASTKQNKIMLDKSSITLYKGESTNIKIKNNVKVKFKSNNKNIATITSNGKIIAKKEGKTTIKVILKSNSNVSKKLKITVKKKPAKSSITMNKKSIKIEAGKTYQLKVKSVKGLSSKDVKYTTKDKTIATVNSKGLVKGIKQGTTEIIVKSLVNSKVKNIVKIETYKSTPTSVYKETPTQTPTSTPTQTPIVHNYNSQYTIYKEPTCTEYGEKARFCTEPEHTDKIDVQQITPLGHLTDIKDTSEEFLAMEGDCENCTLYYYKCSRCGKKTDKIYKGEPLGHIFSDEYTIDIEPNYSEYGEKSRHCLNCNERTDIKVVAKTTTPKWAEGYIFDKLYVDSHKENTIYDYRLACKNDYISGVFAYRFVTKSGNSYIVKTDSYGENTYTIQVYKGSTINDINKNNYITGGNRYSEKTLNFKNKFGIYERYVYASDLISMINSEVYSDCPEIENDIVKNIDYITDLSTSSENNVNSIKAYIIR